MTTNQKSPRQADVPTLEHVSELTGEVDKRGLLRRHRLPDRQLQHIELDFGIVRVAARLSLSDATACGRPMA